LRKTAARLRKTRESSQFWEKKNETAGMTGSTLIRIRTGELVLLATEGRQLLALGERRQRACVKRANQVSFEKKERNGGYVGTHTSVR
jgi:hypothetical protein